MNGSFGNLVYRQSKTSFKYFFPVSIINSICTALCSVIVSKQLKMRKSLPINYRQDTISCVEVNSNVGNIKKHCVVSTRRVSSSL